MTEKKDLIQKWISVSEELKSLNKKFSETLRNEFETISRSLGKNNKCSELPAGNKNKNYISDCAEDDDEIFSGEKNLIVT